MAKTKGGNPVIGSVACTGVDCSNEATVHRVESGSREGQLYLRCTECGPDQRKGGKLQKYITDNAIFREGFENLSTKDPIPKTEPDEQIDIDKDEVIEGELMPIDEPEKKSGAGKAIGLLIGLVAITVLGRQL